jgi:hypothetical protein
LLWIQRRVGEEMGSKKRRGGEPLNGDRRMRFCSCIVVAQSGDEPFTLCGLAIDDAIRQVIRFRSSCYYRDSYYGQFILLDQRYHGEALNEPDREERPSQPVPHPYAAAVRKMLSIGLHDVEASSGRCADFGISSVSACLARGYSFESLKIF